MGQLETQVPSARQLHEPAAQQAAGPGVPVAELTVVALDLVGAEVGAEVTLVIFTCSAAVGRAVG